jgi:hypothetical protein
VDFVDWKEYLQREDEDQVNLQWFGDISGFQDGFPTSIDFCWYSPSLYPVLDGELEVLDKLAAPMLKRNPTHFGVEHAISDHELLPDICVYRSLNFVHMLGSLSSR